MRGRFATLQAQQTPFFVRLSLRSTLYDWDNWFQVIKYFQSMLGICILVSIEMLQKRSISDCCPITPETSANTVSIRIELLLRLKQRFNTTNKKKSKNKNKIKIVRGPLTFSYWFYFFFRWLGLSFSLATCTRELNSLCFRSDWSEIKLLLSGPDSYAWRALSRCLLLAYSWVSNNIGREREK